MEIVQVVTDYIRRSLLTATGDMVVRGATIPERLTAGAVGTYLKGKGAGVLPAYESEVVMLGCRVGLGSAQVVTVDTWIKINLDTEDYDIGDNFNVVTHRWTCPQAGYYQIAVNIQVLSIELGGKVEGGVYVNGTAHSPYGYVVSGGPTSPIINASDVLWLNVNDYLELWVMQSTSGNRYLHSGSTYANYLTVRELK